MHVHALLCNVGTVAGVGVEVVLGTAAVTSRVKWIWRRPVRQFVWNPVLWLLIRCSLDCRWLGSLPTFCVSSCEHLVHLASAGAQPARVCSRRRR